MATKNFYERAKKLGHTTDEKKLKEGVSTTIMVQSLEELKELMNEAGVKYSYFDTDKFANDVSPETAIIDKVYRYIFGGEDQLMANDADIIQRAFPLKVQAISQKELTIKKLTISSSQIVIYNCETVIFENGEYIDVVNTDWELQADFVIINGNPPAGKSRINILGIDGCKGQDGKRGNDGEPGKDGGTNSDAVNGEDGKNAIEKGGFGQNGFQGTGHKSALIMITKDLSGILSVSTKSGKGGDGGDGGKGGKGGKGGHGGNVSSGLCKDINGGNAGKGGNGSDGGNGGKGGDGGHSHEVPVLVLVSRIYEELVETKVEHPSGGNGGAPGAGGAPGNGNIGGYGNCDGSRGQSSNAGDSGKQGYRGDKGTTGFSSNIDIM